IVWRDPRNAGCGGIAPEQLPDDLLVQSGGLHFAAPLHNTENVSVGDARRRGPSINRDLNPGRHRHRPDPTMLPDQIDDAPAPVPLLNVLDRKCRYFRPSQPTSEDSRLRWLDHGLLWA